MQHIAFIIDGNGRWATMRGLSRTVGHIEGAKAVLRVIDAVDALAIPYVTFYAFSAENFKRSTAEVLGIFSAIAYFLDEILLPLIKVRGYQVRFIGDIARLSDELLLAISAVNKVALNNKGMTITIAVAYSGTDEVARAFNYLLEQKMLYNDATPLSYEDIKPYLYTANTPEPDAIVRYGGYQRLSNFLPLQSVYSELFFKDKLWPDVNSEDINEVYNQYAKVKRNFGDVSK